MRSQLKEGLKHSLTRDLPGVEAQMKMVPAHRQMEMEKRNQRNDAKKAAVLICFYPNENDIHLALIRRNEYDGVHSGQISFPGGRYEDGDTDLVQTALREAEEETNIRRHEVEVLGKITPVYIPPSNFCVDPVVGWSANKPNFVPDSAEVQEILSIPIHELLSPENKQLKNIRHRDYHIINVPCYYIQGHIIWGATAMILSEVEEIIIGSWGRVQGARE